MSSTSSHSQSSPNDHFSFLPPIIVYDLQASIPKTDPYSLFRSTSNSIFQNPPPYPIIREEDPEDPLSPLPSHRTQVAEHNFLKPNSNQFKIHPRKNPSRPSTSGSRFSEDTDSEEDEDDSESVIRDGFEFDEINLASPSASILEPVFLSSTTRNQSFRKSQGRSGSYHSQDEIISPLWKSAMSGISSRNPALGGGPSSPVSPNRDRLLPSIHYSFSDSFKTSSFKKEVQVD